MNARMVVEASCTLVINTDAHTTDHMRFIRLGIAMARRGWLQTKDVLNTVSLNQLKKQMNIN